MGLMFGSERFRAPEELALGAPVDSRTTAYVMARAALVLMPDPPPAIAEVLVEATTARFPSYPAFYDAWLTASSTIEDSPIKRSR